MPYAFLVKEECIVNDVDNHSEVARLMQQISLEYEAAQRGLTGSAITANHAFITARMERVSQHYEALKLVVGEREAIKLVVQCLEENTSNA